MYKFIIYFTFIEQSHSSDTYLPQIPVLMLANQEGKVWSLHLSIANLSLFRSSLCWRFNQLELPGSHSPSHTPLLRASSSSHRQAFPSLHKSGSGPLPPGHPGLWPPCPSSLTCCLLTVWASNRQDKLSLAYMDRVYAGQHRCDFGSRNYHDINFTTMTGPRNVLPINFIFHYMVDFPLYFSC